MKKVARVSLPVLKHQHTFRDVVVEKAASCPNVLYLLHGQAVRRFQHHVRRANP